MKKLCVSVLAVIMLFAFSLPMLAANGKVTYSGDAGEFIFAPGSKYSPTDLFPNFKDVMPGDSITQDITVRNDASNGVKVKIYVRSLGAHEDSVEFLSELHLRVRASDNNEMAYMFDAAANETAGMTDWVCLGTLYSGGEVNLEVILDVPTSLDNRYKNEIGYIDWEFKIEEFPIEPDDPEPPDSPGTHDGSNMPIYIGIMVGSLILIVILLIVIFKRRKKSE